MIKILIVDDSAYNLFVLEELLNEMPYLCTITRALNGEEAIK